MPSKSLISRVDPSACRSSRPRETLAMNDGWRFHPGELAVRNFEATHQRRGFLNPEWLKVGNHGPSRPNYPDTDWLPVALPHDFVIDGVPSRRGNFDHGSLLPGVGWYRRTFFLPASDSGRRLWLEFDGLYRDAAVWINGQYVTRQLSGYTSLRIEITDFVFVGRKNAVTVRVDATGYELWSYEGGGIYRDVRLVKSGPLALDPSSLCITSQLNKDHSSAVVRVAATFSGTPADEPLHAVLEISGPGGERVGSARLALRKGARHLRLSLRLDPVMLWSPDHPALYEARVFLFSGQDRLEDELRDTFGLRTIRFDGRLGFFLNGKTLKLRGVCIHQDHEGVGVAVPPALESWRLARLKEMGCNAIRTAHNPPSPSLLHLCDRLGLMVMDETRLCGSSEEALAQAASLVRRDRNHPSVILWCIGNEEMQIQHLPSGAAQIAKLAAHVRREDPTRPVTYAMNTDWVTYADLHAAQPDRVDVFGANYVCCRRNAVTSRHYDRFHEQHPDWPLIASESGGALSIRGLYRPSRPANKDEFEENVVWTEAGRRGFLSAYADAMAFWGSSHEEVWRACATRPFLAGTFYWTGFDYRGEPFPSRALPAIGSNYGLMDRCGFPKDTYWYFRSQWTRQPTLHLFPHWNAPACGTGRVDVRCATNCRRVELRLNGRSLGPRDVPPFETVRWAVDYEPGVLAAIGYDETGREVARTQNETTGPAVGLDAEVEIVQAPPDTRVLAIARVFARDQEGRVVPDSVDQMEVALSGDAALLGLGNGDPHRPGSEKTAGIRLFAGLAQVILLATGREAQLAISSPTLRRVRLPIRFPRPRRVPVVRVLGATGQGQSARPEHFDTILA